MRIHTKYDLFQKVFICNDPEQCERTITEIKIMPGAVLYQLTYGMLYSEHYEQEISATRDVLKTLENDHS